ncbi:S9 family peptidase [Longispora albida]|uniref:S9 family peptidase n=1 Tax=Longispora albida TaxID=203523 RepID=UPI0003638F78|nr:prolyl oligopeptidase family serine peptidase [Longispora albida]
MPDQYLADSARTGRFSFGAPRAITVTSGGSGLLLLRSSGPSDPVDALWTVDVATGAERRLADPLDLFGRPVAREDLPAAERMLRERLRLQAAGIGSYASDGEVAVFTLGGRLFEVTLSGAETREIETGGRAWDPRPRAGRVAYVEDDAVYVTGIGQLTPDDGARWGISDFNTAEELGRSRGHWWLDDGTLLIVRTDESMLSRRHVADPASPEEPVATFAYPLVGGPIADTALYVVALDGTRNEVIWDRQTYPYLTEVDGRIITVYDRLQQNCQLLEITKGGQTTQRAALADEYWIEQAGGLPALLDDGRMLHTIDGETRSLAVGGKVITPPELYVRRYAGVLGDELVIEAGVGDPSEQHLFLVTLDGELTRLTHQPGVHSAITGGATIVVTSATVDGVVRTAGGHTLTDLAAKFPYRVEPILARVTEHQIPTAVVYPRGHVPGTKLPVLIDIYGGPGYQDIALEPRRWNKKQWWADQGFAVVTIDNRGTPNVSPAFTRAIFRGWSQVVLDDQVAALHELAAAHPDFDLTRVGMRGWSYGGYLSALAVLRRPDVFHAGSAGAPPTDFRWYDTAYTERYLGLPAENPDGYAADALIGDAAKLSRPLLLIHGYADDNVHPLHTVRLSEALTGAAQPHNVLMLPGVSHMTPPGLQEDLALIELDFLRKALG